MTLPRLDGDALHRRLEKLATIGGIDGGGVCRLALSDEDKAGRDQCVAWMRELGLAVSVDPIGNIMGIRKGRRDLPPVTTGSHLDTVRTGGRYDGALGVMAGLEVVAALNRLELDTEWPIAVGAFTNEEGARFAPDMMGSAVQQGQLDLQSCLGTRDASGVSVGEELRRIGYAGEAPWFRASGFLELHIEQGPVLEAEGVTLGAVTGVQGISWTELTLRGVSNHAGTTPIALRHDAGLAAAEIAVGARRIADEIGGGQVATVGSLSLYPNLVNVIAQRAVMTVDLRNIDEALLQQAEARLGLLVDEVAARQGIKAEARGLARFAPVAFDAGVVGMVADLAVEAGASVRRMASGAGHDAQMFAPNCPTGMIFVPSVGGISHNIAEFTAERDIETGADILLRAMLRMAQSGGFP